MIQDSPFFLICISIRRRVTLGPVAQGYANRTGGGGGRMDGNDHTARQSRRDERHIRAIEVGAKGSCLPPVSSILLAFHLPWPCLSCFFPSISRCVRLSVWIRHITHGLRNELTSSVKIFSPDHHTFQKNFLRLPGLCCCG